MKHKIAKPTAAAQTVREVYRFPGRVAESEHDKFLEERAELETQALRAIASFRKTRLELGKIFNRLKATLKHGEWERYYEKTFGDSAVSFRSAERYMKLAAQANADSDSLSILKPGMDQHAVSMRKATERAQVAVGDVPKQEQVYRLAIHLSPDKRDATIRLWASPHRPSAERELVSVLERLHVKFGVVNADSLKAAETGRQDEHANALA